MLCEIYELEVKLVEICLSKVVWLEEKKVVW